MTELNLHSMLPLRGTLQAQVPLAAYTSWKIGGPAQWLYEPADLEDLVYLLQSLASAAPAMPLTWLGLGSNTLVRDGGVRGMVIITQGVLAKLDLLNASTVRAEVGVACPTLARYTARQGLQNLEFLAGIPGTIGGALAMNAGCHGQELWHHVQAVETVDQFGQIHTRLPQDFTISYRSAQGRSAEWFVAGHFRVCAGNKAVALERIRALLAHRQATQPTGEPSCGSTFQNPPGYYAGQLIEACGLKGKRQGQAAVSTKHANFIINLGGATASDVEALIALIQNTVQQKHGILLQREVHIIGAAITANQAG